MSGSYQYIAAEQNGPVLVLTIKLTRIGEYELAEALGRELSVAASQEEDSDVVVDLCNVEYMSSVGYGPLVSLRSQVRASGRRLVLCNLSALLKQMFDTTRLLINPHSPKSLFEYAATRKDALDLLSDSAGN